MESDISDADVGKMAKSIAVSLPGAVIISTVCCGWVVTFITL